MDSDTILSRIRELRSMLGVKSKVDEDGMSIDSKASIPRAKDEKEPLNLKANEYFYKNDDIDSKLKNREKAKLYKRKEPKVERKVNLKVPEKAKRQEVPKLSIVSDSESDVEVKKPDEMEAKKIAMKEKMAKLRAARKQKAENTKVDVEKTEEVKPKRTYKKRTEKTEDAKTETPKPKREYKKKVKKDEETDEAASKYVKPN